jgi:type IV pilus assembly protein PilA
LGKHHPRQQETMHMLKKLKEMNEHGFTLIELMIVVAIIGVLAAIAVPNFISYRQRAYDSAALADLRNAYTAAQNLFSQLDGASITTPNLVAGGFKASPDVTVTVVGHTQGTLSITAKHNQSSITYTIDSDGRITKS